MGDSVTAGLCPPFLLGRRFEVLGDLDDRSGSRVVVLDDDILFLGSYSAWERIDDEMKAL